MAKWLPKTLWWHYHKQIWKEKLFSYSINGSFCLGYSVCQGISEKFERIGEKITLKSFSEQNKARYKASTTYKTLHLQYSP
jgi:hypothetical protein